VTVRIVIGALIAAATTTLAAQTGVPASSLGADSHAALEKRCGTPKTASAESIAALRRARWVPFLHLDQAIARNGIEVVGGMTAATPGCEPELFNLFVFVDRVFAGTVSPMPMTPSRDRAAGAVRITGADTLTVEFARYMPGDAECCPSARERVSYRIDKTGAGPTLVATDTRQVR
jgi:LppP/LprE lipoprotein